VPRVTRTATRWLPLLLVAFACLMLPTGVGAETAGAIRPSAGVSLVPDVQGTKGSNGWYVSNVFVNWTFVPSTPSSVIGCFIGEITAEGHTHIDCKASWSGLGSAEVILDIYIDKTPPTVHAVPSRPPNAYGWYTKPVSIAFAGTDAISGIAACSSTTYSGPDTRTASVAGTCTDKAGNVGRAVYRFSYDSTPPTVTSVTAEHGNRSVLLRWKTSSDTRVSEVTRSGGSSPHEVVYRGTRNEVRDKGLRVAAKYRYTITATNEAGNTGNATLAVTATGPLTGPVPGQRVTTSRPRLSWLPVKGASYYNVQLYRGGRILSAWPKRTSLALPASWAYQGQRHRLHSGSYRWYVWPGFGKPAQAHYGHLLGSSSFVYAH
jgi:hypothetical protein